MRIDKYISMLGRCSRREARHFIRRYSLHISKVSHTDPNQANPAKGQHHIQDGMYIVRKDTDSDEWDSLVVRTQVHAILHKPIGYVCSDVTDGGHPSYRELLQDRPYSHLAHLAGRLDVDSTGLLILTSDGTLQHRITSPKHACIKKYLIQVPQELTALQCKKLQEGVVLDTGYTTLPADVTQEDVCSYTISIQEGKFHQIKKMLEAVGSQVLTLHRTHIGGLGLQGLGEGERLSMTQKELTDTIGIQAHSS